jgi:hypothetical protein
MTTEEVIKELRRPFKPDEVNWKIQTNGKKASLCVSYIDARHVSERFNGLGLVWTSEFEDVTQGNTRAVICKLTVADLGTRCDVGSDDNVQESHGLKAIYSDALKRAAVHFGIGTPLYYVTRQYLYFNDKDDFGYFKDNRKKDQAGQPAKVPGSISDKGQEKLAKVYAEFVNSKSAIEKFGEPL